MSICAFLFYFILFYSILFFVIAKVLNTQVERHIESTYTFRRQTARSSDSSLAQCLVIESAEADERIRFFMQFNPKSFEEISTRYSSSSSSSSSTSTSSFFFFFFFLFKKQCYVHSSFFLSFILHRIFQKTIFWLFQEDQSSLYLARKLFCFFKKESLPRLKFQCRFL